MVIAGGLVDAIFLYSGQATGQVTLRQGAATLGIVKHGGHNLGRLDERPVHWFGERLVR
jgi:hypothetical protein